MAKFEDLTGKRFGRWTVLELVRKGINLKGKPNPTLTRWLCRCDCGTVKDITQVKTSQSCGCFRAETASVRSRRHGHTFIKDSVTGLRGTTGTYQSWAGMIKRCFDPKTPQWADWGGRGITVCERWRKFENFLADMGERPAGKSIDRFPDNDGNYEPGNCRWADRDEQNNNKRQRKDRTLFTIGGRLLTIQQAAVEVGLKTSTLRERLRQGWPLEEALALPNAGSKGKTLWAERRRLASEFTENRPEAVPEEFS